MANITFPSNTQAIHIEELELFSNSYNLKLKGLKLDILPSTREDLHDVLPLIPESGVISPLHPNELKNQKECIPTKKRKRNDMDESISRFQKVRKLKHKPQNDNIMFNKILDKILPDGGDFDYGLDDVVIINRTKKQEMEFLEELDKQLEMYKETDIDKLANLMDRCLI